MVLIVKTLSSEQREEREREEEVGESECVLSGRAFASPFFQCALNVRKLVDSIFFLLINDGIGNCVPVSECIHL